MQRRPLVLFLAVVLLGVDAMPTGAADRPPSAVIDYEYPARLTGTIHDLPPAEPRLRFTFKREAVREGDTLRVLREYRNPAGVLVATERVRYEAGRLASFELGDLQAGATGRVDVAPLPRGGSRLRFEYRAGPDARVERNSEETADPVLVNDMIAPYLEAHWPELNAGKPVAFRLVALDRGETVGFKLLRERAESLGGRPVTVVRMKPSSAVISLVVDPIFFTVESEGGHRILRYTGRTTPKTGRPGAWRDLDALTIFDWTSAPERR